MNPSSPKVKWGGTASDGTKLANGAYIVRVVASDGQRTEEANLKVVIWRD
jgi:flagellar hook assembly protein FlgD